MRSLQLYFSEHGEPELIETRFTHDLLDSERRAVRGKSGGAYLNYGSFQWTIAVRAMVELLLRAVIDPRQEHTAAQPHLIGNRGSSAASLDYALSKEPVWLYDMFGGDSRGRILARRLIIRSNSEMKMPGPVALSLNPKLLSEEDISVYCGDKKVTERATLVSLLDAAVQSAPATDIAA